MRSTPFLTRNRHGIYCFYRRTPRSVTKKFPSVSKFVRLSLGTKDKRLAQRKARIVTVMWDAHAEMYFPDKESYDKGMELLRTYIRISDVGSYEEMMDFIDDLDETSTDYGLLERALGFRKSLLVRDTESSDSRGNGQLLDQQKKTLENLEKMLESHVANTNGATQSYIMGIGIDEAFQRFLNEREQTWKSHSDQREAYEKDYYPVFKVVVGDVLTTQIDKRHVGEFVSFVLKLPQNRSKKPQYRDKTLLELKDIDVPITDRLSDTTKEKYIQQIGAFLKWLKRYDYTAIDLHEAMSGVKLQKTQANQNRDAFTKEEIRALLNSPDYRLGLHEVSTRFWAPLICLYTGARINEICQLEIRDFGYESSIKRWVFDINEDQPEDQAAIKSVKREHCARRIPVHMDLIDLGLVEYYEEIKKQGATWLFPDVSLAKKGNRGTSTSRWFNDTYLHKCGVRDKGDKQSRDVSFHSFRHTVVTYLCQEKGQQPNDICYLFGHKPEGKTTTEKVYRKDPPPESFIRWIDMLDFRKFYDTGVIRHWRHHRFHKQPVKSRRRTKDS